MRLVASAPVLTHRSYDVGHPPVLTENYETWGLGDTLVGVRHALVASTELSLVAGAGGLDLTGALSYQANTTNELDYSYGEGVESTGGSIAYAIPGLVTTLPAGLSLYFFLPVPVYRYVNETQVAPRLSLVVGMARAF